MKKNKPELFEVSSYSEATLNKTIKKHQKEIKEINEYYGSWSDLVEIIKSNYEESNPLHNLNIESIFSMDSSTLLVLTGFYKQAISLLRIWFENSMFSIYFQNHFVEFDRWRFEDNAFRMNFSKELLDYLFLFPTFKEFNEEFKKGYNTKKYLFSWDNIPEKDSMRLINHLVKNLKIGWAKNGTINKNDNGKIITITEGKNSLEIKLNKKENKVILEISGGKTYEYLLKEKKGKLNIYVKNEGFGFKSFREWIEEIYCELSAHIHGRGYHRSNLANIKFYRGEMKSYNKDTFSNWYYLYINVCQILIISFLKVLVLVKD